MQITPHFKLEEFHCRDGTRYPEEWIESRLKPLCEALEKIREKAGGALVVSSGYRSPKHNAAIGGASESQHLEGRAADIYCKRLSGRQLATITLKLMRAKEIPWGGLGTYPNRIHYDIRGSYAAWEGKK